MCSFAEDPSWHSLIKNFMTSYLSLPNQVTSPSPRVIGKGALHCRGGWGMRERQTQPPLHNPLHQPLALPKTSGWSKKSKTPLCLAFPEPPLTSLSKQYHYGSKTYQYQETQKHNLSPALVSSFCWHPSVPLSLSSSFFSTQRPFPFSPSPQQTELPHLAAPLKPAKGQRIPQRQETQTEILSR